MLFSVCGLLVVCCGMLSAVVSCGCCLLIYARGLRGCRGSLLIAVDCCCLQLFVVVCCCLLCWCVASVFVVWCCVLLIATCYSLSRAVC